MYFILGFILGILFILLIAVKVCIWFKSMGFTEDDLYEDTLSVIPEELFSLKDIFTEDKFIAYADKDENIHAYCIRTKTHLVVFKEADKSIYRFKRLSIGSKRFFRWWFKTFKVKI